MRLACGRRVSAAGRVRKEGDERTVVVVGVLPKNHDLDVLQRGVAAPGVHVVGCAQRGRPVPSAACPRVSTEGESAPGGNTLRVPLSRSCVPFKPSLHRKRLSSRK